MFRCVVIWVDQLKVNNVTNVCKCFASVYSLYSYVYMVAAIFITCTGSSCFIVLLNACAVVPIAAIDKPNVNHEHERLGYLFFVAVVLIPISQPQWVVYLVHLYLYRD